MNERQVQNREKKRKRKKRRKEKKKKEQHFSHPICATNRNLLLLCNALDIEGALLAAENREPSWRRGVKRTFVRRTSRHQT